MILTKFCVFILTKFKLLNVWFKRLVTEKIFSKINNILTSEEIDNSRKDVMLMLNNETKLKFYDNGHDNESIRSDKV